MKRGSGKWASPLMSTLRHALCCREGRATTSSQKRVMAPEDGRRFFLGDASARHEEGLIVKDLGSTVRTLRWRIAAALVVACLLAVGGWVFAQDKPATPAAPAAPSTDTTARTRRSSRSVRRATSRPGRVRTRSA